MYKIRPVIRAMKESYMEYENINKRQHQQEGLGKAFLNKSRLR